jgi:predicted glycosyltransferase
MKIVFYCQYVWGMGHLFRTIEFARALSEHAVTLVAGGQKVDVDLPRNVTFLRLPTLFMDEQFTTLIPGNPLKSLGDIQRERKTILFDLFERQRPDLFIVELFPFGRTKFEFELLPLLQSIRDGRYGNTKSICSLRDILVEKKKPEIYEERVLNYLSKYFDLLLVHSDEKLIPLDETFGRVKEIPVPLMYTGFIARKEILQNGADLGSEFDRNANEKLIVASAGGGRSGYLPLKNVLLACRGLNERMPFRLQVFAGPFMDDAEFEELCSLAGPGMNVLRFTKHFLDYLYAADLSISLAGYNTCMNLLVTRVPALVIPYRHQREQPLRLEKFKSFMPIKILAEKDLKPDLLCEHIRQMLLAPPACESAELNLNGAENAAQYLKDWVAQDDTQSSKE